MNKNILYILILIFISNCSFSKKDSDENEKIIDIFKKVEPIQKEFNSNLRIKKLETFKYQPFLRNYSNNNGNINFDTNFENISTFKFSNRLDIISTPSLLKPIRLINDFSLFNLNNLGFLFPS